MKPSDFARLIETRFKAGIKRPLLVEASPGVGKTQIPAQVAKNLDIGYRVIHAPLMQPEDYGFPVISNDKTDVDFIVSKHKFPLEGSDCPDKGILLIDEIAQADNNAQKILANVLQEREIHGKRLKDGWIIVATGNRVSDRAGANRILSHLSNRLTRIQLDVSLDDWCQWAIANNISPEIIAFVRFRPELLDKFDSHQDINPTPRAWAEGVSKALGVVAPDHEFECFRGDVGEGAATEFLSFLKIYRKLPNIDLIISEPTKAEVPTDPATLYALCGALAHRTKEDNFGKVLKYVKRIPKEFGILYIRDTILRTPAIQTTNDFIKWMSSTEMRSLII